MSRKLNLVAVSYFNTLPFISAIKESDLLSDINVNLQHPANCARAALEGTADIALIPVAILNQLTDYTVVTDYCIGCNGRVDSVMLYSQVTINEIQNVVLDYQSKTSVQLVKVLAENYWDINPNWQQGELGFENSINGNTAAVVIGDRTFEMHGKFKYEYDLGEEWKKYSGLPFVFAVWVAKNNVDSEIIESLNATLKHGIASINLLNIDNQNLNESQVRYLRDRINYRLDANKRNGLARFLKLLENKPILS